jgi:hypothetical protein
MGIKEQVVSSFVLLCLRRRRGAGDERILSVLGSLIDVFNVAWVGVGLKACQRLICEQRGFI